MNMKVKVEEIRKIAIEKSYENYGEEFGRYDNIEEGFDNMTNDKFLTVNHLPGIANR
jgi:hypothetical protein